VQMPKSTQGFNRYAYVQNNPLKYTDPSGYFLKSLMKSISRFLRKYARTIIAMVIIIYPPIVAALGPFLTGFVSGMVASGGDFKTAMIGGMMAWTAFNIAHSPIGKELFNTSTKQVLAHGVSQGAFAEMRGGKFKEGFLGAVVAKMMPVPDAVQNSGVAGRTTFAALSGGIASELGGGKFKNGAVSAAFVHLFNDE